MKPYNVEIFTPDFMMVGHTNINELSYKEDYLSSDENSITVFAIPGVAKQDYIRISRGKEEYAGVVTEIAYGTDKSKNMQTISLIWIIWIAWKRSVYLWLPRTSK